MSDKFDRAFVESVIEHMNIDHSDAVLNSALAFAPELNDLGENDVEHVRLTDVDAGGIRIELTTKSRQEMQVVVAYSAAGLPGLLDSQEQVRSALVIMAKKARQRISTR